MTKEELIALSDLNREDNIKYISSEAQGIAIALGSDRHSPDLCKLERAYICGRRKSENYIADLEKEKCELLGIIQGKDEAIKDLEWQLQEVAKDNDVYQAENKRLQKENARMRELLKTLSESIVMTADDVFWNLKKDVEKFFEVGKYKEHQTEEM